MEEELYEGRKVYNKVKSYQTLPVKSTERTQKHPTMLNYAGDEGNGYTAAPLGGGGRRQ